MEAAIGKYATTLKSRWAFLSAIQDRGGGGGGGGVGGGVQQRAVWSAALGDDMECKVRAHLAKAAQFEPHFRKHIDNLVRSRSYTSILTSQTYTLETSLTSSTSEIHTHGPIVTTQQPLGIRGERIFIDRRIDSRRGPPK